MGLFSFLGTSSKAVDAATGLIGGVVDGIDAVILTEEEKIKFDLKRTELWLKMQEVIANESTVRSVTRRVLAVVSFIVYLTLNVASCIVWPFAPEHSDQIFKVAMNLNKLVIPITVFYFGYYAISNVIKAKKG